MSYRKYLMADDVPPSELYKAVELGTNLAEVGTDCISRQSAIDAVNCVMVMKGIRSGKSVTAEAVNCAKRIIADNIRQLPPIQPKRGRWILDRSGAYCCSECMEPCASYVMMKPRDKFCKMCGSRNEVTE